MQQEKVDVKFYYWHPPAPKDAGIHEVDIRVARFLGVQVRFRVTRRRLPPNCDRRCALQRVEPCQNGLPPRIQRASTTAGCSASEVARFASPEVLGRAWFTLPLCNCTGLLKYLSIVGCVIDCRIHPDPKGSGILLDSL
jgi:hypothetical protein